MFSVDKILGFYQISATAPENQESSHFYFSKFGQVRLRQISSHICRMPVQLQYDQLITDKTNVADLSSHVFAILLKLEEKNTKFAAVPHISLKTGKQ